MLVAALASGVTACAQYNPSADQREVDHGATAGVVGAAMGAAILPANPLISATSKTR